MLLIDYFILMAWQTSIPNTFFLKVFSILLALMLNFWQKTNIRLSRVLWSSEKYILNLKHFLLPILWQYKIVNQGQCQIFISIPGHWPRPTSKGEPFTLQPIWQYHKQTTSSASGNEINHLYFSQSRSVVNFFVRNSSLLLMIGRRHILVLGRYMYRVDTIYKSRKLDTEGIKWMYRKSPLLYLNFNIYTISKRGCKQQTKEYQV